MHKIEQLRKELLRRFNDGAYKGAEEIQGWKLEIKQEDSTVYITASRMYNYLPLNFDTMKVISEILGTTKIDDAQRTHHSGCETCDYGSKYQWTLVCKECQL